MKLYFTSPKFKKLIPDWILTIGLVIFFFNVTEVARPFMRQFSLDDASISHPFATKERVTDNELYVWSAIVPLVIIVILSALNASTTFDKLHLITVSSVGLWFTVSVTSVLTDILKCWIGNPRPDFLARCGAREGTPTNVLVDISVCTAPLGEMYLLDGMKLTPSGHSSLAFSGLGYLTLWLLGQYKVLNVKQRSSMLTILLLSSPMLLAVYIALSRTQDYRHHFFDVLFGSVIGLVFAFLGYKKYFSSIFGESSNIPLEWDNVEYWAERSI